MKRKIITIDENLCNGCGQCVVACAEGAIEIVDGKAKLVKEQFCDGFGDCVGQCPQGAMFIEEQEAEAFDPEATKHHLFQTKGAEAVTRMEEASVRHATPPGGCPGSRAMQFDKPPAASTGTGQVPSQLTHWPIQMTLVSPDMPVFKNADLLLAADCTAFVYGDFHRELLAGKALIIGCPKLDNTDPYLAKLTRIIKTNDLKSLTVAHMEVPCCHGLVHLAKEALQQAGSDLELRIVTVGINGQLK
ncbi:MAG: 4Fe-4S dicluster domain-containing protein [Actinobacteria bacterium]|nr:4Fe-4S dicluster domain-containing protein [Actinomycetota bacterium]